MQKDRAKRNGSPVVVSDHMGSVEPPVLEQVAEQFRLNVERDRMPRILGGLAVAGHVP
jgi:hypothetical protein